MPTRVLRSRTIHRLAVAALATVVATTTLAPPTIAGSSSRADHGVLSVSTSPAVDSLILVDGIARNTRSIEGLELPAGTHEISYLGVDGYLPPTSQTVRIEAGETSSITGRLRPAGQLRVTTEPADLAPVITVNGIERDRGSTTLVVETGSVEVCPAEVTGYKTPDCRTVAVGHRQTAEVSFTYEPIQDSDPDGPVRVAAGLIALHDYVDGKGNTVPDVVGNLDLRIANPSNVTWTDEGLRFDRPTIARTPTAPTALYDAIRRSNEYTFEAWITAANATQSGPARIITLSRDTANHNFLVGQGVHQGTSQRIEARSHDRSRDYKVQTANGTFGTELTHLAVTRTTDGTMSIYLNGELASRKRMNDDLSAWNRSYALAIGQDLNGDRPWLGTYHLTAVYADALTADDIRQNFGAGPTADAGPSGDPTDPDKDDPEGDSDPTPVPSDWKSAFESGNIDVLRSWYEKHTGHEANGYSISDLDRVGNIMTEYDGQVIEGVNANSIRIAHDDVTIRNSRIRGSANYGISYAKTWSKEVGNTLIEYVTFDGWSGPSGNINHAAYLAANDDGAVVRRVRITGYSSGVSMRSNTSFEESWVRGLYRGPGTGHGTSSTIRGSDNAVVRNLLEGPGGSSAVSLYADHGGAVHNALVESNVLNDGYPHYQINIPNRDHTDDSRNVRIRNNRFGPDARAPHIAGAGNFRHPSTDVRDNKDF